MAKIQAGSGFRKFYDWIRKDINNFVRALGIPSVTFQQQQLLDEVQRATIQGDRCRIACRSGQGPGKSFSSSIVGPWRNIRNRNAKLIVCAPSMHQAKDVWLAQAKKHINNPKAHPYLREIFNFTNTGFGICGRKANEWGCMLKTATSAENMRGQHEENMDIIIEEASGVADDIVTILRGTQSNRNGLFLMIGNPSQRNGAFFDAFHVDSHKWIPLHWNAEDLEDKGLNWFDPQRNWDYADTYGKDSDFYRINVLGEFPLADPNSVISESELRRCLGLANIGRLQNMMVGGRIPQQMGLDFARFGGDENVRMTRMGNAIIDWNFQAKLEPIELVRQSFLLQNKLRWRNENCIYVPDSVGLGQGVMFAFREADKRVHEFHAAKNAKDKKQFADQITEAWFNTAKKIKKMTFHCPNDKRLIHQLTTRRYYHTKKGQIKVETKEEYKKRGYDSPDRADSLVMAMYDQSYTWARVG